MPPALQIEQARSPERRYGGRVGALKGQPWGQYPRGADIGVLRRTKNDDL
jgi:hypothetical protein